MNQSLLLYYNSSFYFQNSLSNTENECSHLGDLNKKKEQEIEALLEKNTENEKEIASLTKKLQVTFFIDWN